MRGKAVDDGEGTRPLSLLVWLVRVIEYKNVACVIKGGVQRDQYGITDDPVDACIHVLG